MPYKKPNELYRYFDDNDVLLYIGISLSSVARASQHRANSHWYSQATCMRIERFPTRRDLEIAEQKAIFFERPIHNIMRTYATLPRPASEHPMPAGLRRLSDAADAKVSMSDDGTLTIGPRNGAWIGVTPAMSDFFGAALDWRDTNPNPAKWPSDRYSDCPFWDYGLGVDIVKSQARPTPSACVQGGAL